MSYRSAALLIFLAAAIMLAGCTLTDGPSTPAAATPTTTKMLEETPSPPPTSLPSSTSAPTLMRTQTATATAVAHTPGPTTTVTHSPTKTPPPTTTATWTPTPLPTIPPEQREAFIRQLIESNANCEFMCWWGVVPGKTKWSEHVRFLETFADDIDIDRNHAAMFQVHPTPENTINAPLFYDIFTTHGVSDDVITWIHTGDKYTTHYTIPQVLTRHGPPDEIGVVFAAAELRLELEFIYNEGIEVFYRSKEVIRENDQAVGCFDEEFPQIGLYEPDHPYIGMSKGDLPIEEALGITPDQFHARYHDATEPICLSAPIERWPMDFWPLEWHGND